MFFIFTDDTDETMVKIVHNLVISKLDLDKLLGEYKLYEDVMPLLKLISDQVILAMNFMFSLEKLSALNPTSITGNRFV